MSDIDAADESLPFATDEAVMAAYLLVEDEAVRIRDHFVATKHKERSLKLLKRRISRLDRAERALRLWEEAFNSWKSTQTEDVATLLVARALKVLVLGNKYAGAPPEDLANIGACLHGWLKERVLQ